MRPITGSVYATRDKQSKDFLRLNKLKFLVYICYALHDFFTNSQGHGLTLIPVSMASIAREKPTRLTFSLFSYKASCRRFWVSAFVNLHHQTKSACAVQQPRRLFCIVAPLDCMDRLAAALCLGAPPSSAAMVVFLSAD